MSSWETPKIDWDAYYVPDADDLNRIEGNASELFFKESLSGADRMGQAEIGEFGYVVVATTAVKSNSRVFVSYASAVSVSEQPLSVTGLSAGVSFQINGGVGEIVNWLLINP
jgi:hypothetical protein